MNNLDPQYLNLLKDILENGIKKSDRTGTGTISVFGRQIRHSMKDGFPLITTKKMAFKSIVTELLWFLRGDTNIKYLVDNNCHIWDGDCYKNYEKRYYKEIFDPTPGAHNRLMSKDEFIINIKTNDEFAKQFGDLGPIYGKQWRNWENEIVNYAGTKYNSQTIDQIQQLIDDLKTNPDSRRLIVSAWNVADLHNMVLPPCHYGFQVYTRELSIDERMKIWAARGEDGGTLLWAGNGTQDDALDYKGVPKRSISLMWNQRSVDTFLGLPFNIASYGLLLMILAKEVNMIPDELIGNLGDCHLYSNHIEQATEQLTRQPYELPKLNFSDKIEIILKKYRGESVNNLGKDYGYFNELNNVINSMNTSDFILENYQSHNTIKAPLSN